MLVAGFYNFHTYEVRRILLATEYQTLFVARKFLLVTGVVILSPIFPACSFCSGFPQARFVGGMEDHKIRYGLCNGARSDFQQKTHMLQRYDVECIGHMGIRKKPNSEM